MHKYSTPFKAANSTFSGTDSSSNSAKMFQFELVIHVVSSAFTSAT